MRTFSDKTNTLLHYTRLKIDDILIGFCLFFYIHTSFNKLSKLCGINLKSFKNLIEKIQIGFKKLEGNIELDEMYFKSGLKGRYYSNQIKYLGREARKRGLKRKKRGRGRYDEDLCPLITIYERKGDFKLIPIKSASKKDIKSEVENNCLKERSKFYTDEWKSYNFIKEREVVNHSQKEYSRKGVHINTAEGLHNLFRIFMSVHMGINKENLENYILWFKIMKQSMKKETNIELIRFFLELLIPRG